MADLGGFSALFQDSGWSGEVPTQGLPNELPKIPPHRFVPNISGANDRIGKDFSAIELLSSSIGPQFVFSQVILRDKGLEAWDMKAKT